jgi:HEAT repeat protein
MRDRIDRIIARGKLDSLAGALDGAKVRDVRYAADRLVEAAGDGQVVLKHIRDLVVQKDSASLHLACQLVPACYRHDAKPALKLLQRLADDADWTVRDAAAETCGRLLRNDFTEMLGPLREWREHASVNVRRAVVIAASRAARPDRLERAEPLLKLLEPLLSDQDPTIRRNLGPSALGGSLLRSYPMNAFEYLVQWSTSNEPPVLWNVAMAFSAPPAAPIAKKALIVLRKLSLDERRPVWRAVSSAMWKLGRHSPEIVRPELMRWLEDERRVEVAREALKHI